MWEESVGGGKLNTQFGDVEVFIDIADLVAHKTWWDLIWSRDDCYRGKWVDKDNWN